MRLPRRPYRREGPKASPRGRGSLTACWQDPGRERGPGACARRSVGRVRRRSDGRPRAEARHHRQRQRLLLAAGVVLSRPRPAARQGAARPPELGRQARRRDAPPGRRRRSERPGVQLEPLRRHRPAGSRPARAGSLHDLRLAGLDERRAAADARAASRRRPRRLLVRRRAALRRRVHARRRDRAAAGALLDGVERAQPDDRPRAAVEARRQALGDPERDRLRAHLQRGRRRRARHVDPRREDRLRRHRSPRQQRTAERTADDLADRVSAGDEARRCRRLRRLRSPSVSERPVGDADDATDRLDGGHLRQPRHARLRGDQALRPQGDLAGRVRLPDESARRRSRRHPGEAGALPDASRWRSPARTPA